MASSAPLTMAAAKAAIREGLKDGAERDLKTIAEMVSRCFDSEDYREGVRAFMEKRQPRFAGRWGTLKRASVFAVRRHATMVAAPVAGAEAVPPYERGRADLFQPVG